MPVQLCVVQIYLLRLLILMAWQKPAMENKIEMIMVGPEEPLVKGIYDFFKNKQGLEHIKVIGPSKQASQLEGSKAFAKAFMQRHNIPTAAYEEFTAENYHEGVDYIKKHRFQLF